MCVEKKSCAALQIWRKPRKVWWTASGDVIQVGVGCIYLHVKPLGSSKSAAEFGSKRNSYAVVIIIIKYVQQASFWNRCRFERFH